MGIVKSFDGSLIYFEDEGKGAITLVFIHGGGINLENWKYQRKFQNKYRCIFIDLAGHGKSKTSRKNYSMESMGTDVASVIESCGLTNYIIIGHSMGGAISLEAELKSKNKPLGIIIADSLFPRSNSLYVRKSELEISNFIQTSLANPKEFIFNLYDNYVVKRKGFSIIDKEFLLELRDKTNIDIFKSELEELMRWDLFARLELVTSPIKCIVAGVSVPSNSEVRNQYLHYFDVVFIEDAAHFLHLEKPVEFNNLLELKITEIVNNSK